LWLQNRSPYSTYSGSSRSASKTLEAFYDLRQDTILRKGTEMIEIPQPQIVTMTATQKIEAYLCGELHTINLKECIDDIRYDILMKALAVHNGNKTKAAKSIGMKRTNLLHYTLPKKEKINNEHY
jgi:transcriptional regulator with GAF, ATPase, and Fis domain